MQLLAGNSTLNSFGSGISAGGTNEHLGYISKKIKRRSNKTTAKTMGLKKLQAGLKEGDGTGPFES